MIFPVLFFFQLQWERLKQGLLFLFRLPFQLLGWLLNPASFGMIVVVDTCIVIIHARSASHSSHVPLPPLLSLGVLIGVIHGSLGRWLGHTIQQRLEPSEDL